MYLPLVYVLIPTQIVHCCPRACLCVLWSYEGTRCHGSYMFVSHWLFPSESLGSPLFCKYLPLAEVLTPSQVLSVALEYVYGFHCHMKVTGSTRVMHWRVPLPTHVSH